MEKQQDRISFSLGRKINLGNYESQDVHISYSSDCNEGESIKDAHKRVSAVVKALIDNEIKQIAKAKGGKR